MGRVPQSSIIVVGNEILRGFTVDTNSNWLAGRLFRCGYAARIISTIGDIDADIVSTIHEQIKRPELSRIFVCGGLGPTPDDRTYIALGRALGQPLLYRREVGEQMQNLMFISKLAFELGQERYLFALPGVPHELRAVYEEIERRYLNDGQADIVRELHYRLAPESMFHDVMQALEQEYPDVSLGSYPQTETRELTLRASGPNSERVESVIRAIRDRVTQYTPVS
jgi:molybdopterin-biosynthesis enzyme MoeA-like protein